MDLDGTVHARPRTSKHQDPSAHARNSRETNVDLAGRIRRGICAKRNYLSRSVFRARSLGDSCMERSLARPRLERVVGKCNAPKKRRATSRRDVALRHGFTTWCEGRSRRERRVRYGRIRTLRADVLAFGDWVSGRARSTSRSRATSNLTWKGSPRGSERVPTTTLARRTRPARRSREARRHVRASEPRERRRAAERG